MGKHHLVRTHGAHTKLHPMMERLEDRNLFALVNPLSITLPDVATVSFPTPEPALPVAFDHFTPPVAQRAPISTAPAIDETTRTGAPNQIIDMTAEALSRTGTGSDTSFVVYGQNGTNAGKLASATAQTLDGQMAAISLPSTLPTDSMYLIWAKNATGPSYPVAINATEAWWAGPDQATPGQSVSVYGRNLNYSATNSTSWVYLKAPGNVDGVWATVTAANPYKVDFTIPSTLANGSYEVWVHNGHGGHYGWSKAPQPITVATKPGWVGTTFNVKSFGAAGNGVQNDQVAVQAAITAAAAVPNSTVYFPTGNYMLSQMIYLPGNIRLLGDGSANTKIKIASAFLSTAQLGTNPFLFYGVGNNVEFNALTLDANGNLNSWSPMLLSIRGYTDIRINNCIINASGFNYFDFHNSRRVFITNTNIIGTGSFLGSASQVFIDHCNFYGTNDANTLLESWGGDGISVTNSTARDYNNASSTGWVQGRFVYGNGIWGSNRDFYVGDNATYDLAVRPGFWNQNSGEQISWEGNSILYTGTPLSASTSSMTFAAAFPQNFVGSLDAVIISGRGLGQHRTITGQDSLTNTVTFNAPFNVAPDETSTIVFTLTVDKAAIYHNSLDGKSDWATRTTASAGIEPFGGGYDIVADSNTLHELRTAINNSATLSPSYFDLFVNNTIQSCWTGGLSSATGTGSQNSIAGIWYLGNMFRTNSVYNVASPFVLNGAGSPPGKQFALSVFDHNVGIGESFSLLRISAPSEDTFADTLTWGNTTSMVLLLQQLLYLRNATSMPTL